MASSESVRKSLALVALVVGLGRGAVHAQSGVVFDSGPLATNVRDGCNSYDSSRIQTLALGMTAGGFNCSLDAGARIADDFDLAAPTTVTTVTVYLFQSGSGTSCPFDDIRLQIWDGPPNAGGSVVFGNLTTNRFASCEFAKIYRGNDAGSKLCTTPVMALSANVNQALGAGTYWIDFQVGSTIVGDVFAPPVTRVGFRSPCTNGCNALRWNGAAWNPIKDTVSAVDYPLGIKFHVNAATPRSIRDHDATYTRTASSYDSFPSADLKGVAVNPIQDQLGYSGWAYRVAGDTHESFLGAPSSEEYIPNASNLNWTDVGGRGLFSAQEIVSISDTGLGANVSSQIGITNLTQNTLEMELFHITDISLGLVSQPEESSARKAEWSPYQIIRVSDSDGNTADYFSYYGADHFTVRKFGPSDPQAMMADGDVDDFDDAGLPFVADDFTAGYQIHLSIPPGGIDGTYVAIGVNSPLQCGGLQNGLHCDGFESQDFQPWSSTTP